MKARKLQYIMIGMAMVSIVGCSDPDNQVVAEMLDTILDNTSNIQDDSSDLMPFDPAEADFTVTIENVETSQRTFFYMMREQKPMIILAQACFRSSDNQVGIQGLTTPIPRFV